MSELKTLLAKGLDELGVSLSEDQQRNLLVYRDLLARWNKTYNLTAIRDPKEQVVLHLLDSLAVSPLIPAGTTLILDVGSGGGLPGIPLALMHPDIYFTLLDSNGKKSRFLTHLLTQLPLANVSVVHSRVEQFQPGGLFDVVISRAFSSLSLFWELTSPLCKTEGKLLAMKGKLSQQELDLLDDGLLISNQALCIPGVDAERHLVVMKPHLKTDEQRL
ncbi:MAG: 16S rRNA (guanine(527)-N(7))-methyltransferase RsmG [Gammaproteobacteria bacterium]|nr:16S rRNA (guanine(527)-N(7))-methyltransferase RsmG [Gammaproteobacteria bacterium]